MQNKACCWATSTLRRHPCLCRHPCPQPSQVPHPLAPPHFQAWHHLCSSATQQDIVSHSLYTSHSMQLGKSAVADKSVNFALQCSYRQQMLETHFYSTSATSPRFSAMTKRIAPQHTPISSTMVWARRKLIVKDCLEPFSASPAQKRSQGLSTAA